MKAAYGNWGNLLLLLSTLTVYGSLTLVIFQSHWLAVKKSQPKLQTEKYSFGTNGNLEMFVTEMFYSCDYVNICTR